jgi:glycine oxidase
MNAGIVGGGIMGQLMAFHLINAGWCVSLFDKNSVDNCSQAAAGLLTPLAELARNDSLIFQLGKEALSHHWPALLKQLKAPVYFKNEGSIIISHPRDQADLKHFVEIIEEKFDNTVVASLEKQSRPYSSQSLDCHIAPLLATTTYGKAPLHFLNHTQLTALEPDLSKFETGYYFEGEGQIDNQHLLTALKEYLISKNVMWFSNIEVTHIGPHEITTREKKYSFNWVFDCRGLAAKEPFQDLSSLRGELIWLHAPDLHLARPVRFIHPRYSLYIVPRPEQIYLIGATEIESEDFSEISVQSTLELLTAAYAVSSKFAEARILKTVTQCRPTLANRLPKIKQTKGLIAINGLYRHGFLIAPTLALEVMSWLGSTNASYYPTLWETSE